MTVSDDENFWADYLADRHQLSSQLAGEHRPAKRRPAKRWQSDPDWAPSAVGELFMLVFPGGGKLLMRVTDIDGADWNATNASLDEARTVIQAELPHVPSSPHHRKGAR
jgi:hypothetical protein